MMYHDSFHPLNQAFVCLMIYRCIRKIPVRNQTAATSASNANVQESTDSDSGKLIYISFYNSKTNQTKLK